MFSHLTDFSYQRSGVQAVGFYIAYFIVFILIAALLGGFSSLLGGSEAQAVERATQLGIVTVTIGTPIITFLVASKKKLTHQFPVVLLIVVSGILAMFAGALLGLLPAAYLTTKGGGHSVHTPPPTGHM